MSARSNGNAIRLSRGEQIFQVFNYIFLALLAITCVYPLYYVLMASLSDPLEIMKQRGLMFLPRGNITIGSYEMVLANPNIASGYYNTLIYVFLGTAINMVLTITSAYALSRKNLFFGNALTLFIVFTMFFSGGIVPTYLQIRNLRIFDTYWAILLPTAVSAYNMIIMRTSFMGIPESLIESAKIEGAGELTILTRIVLPVSQAVVAVIVLFYAVSNWNTWFNAAIYLQRRELFPLQLVLREILISNDTRTMTTAAAELDKEPISLTVKYSTTIIATLPVLLVYPFIQKYFVKGVMIGAVKG